MDINSINALNTNLIQSFQEMELPEGMTIESSVSEDNNIVITINNANTNTSMTVTFTAAELDTPEAVDLNGDGMVDAEEMIQKLEEEILATIQGKIDDLNNVSGTSNQETGAFSKVIFDIFQMMQILIACAQKQRDSAMQSRQADRETQAQLELNSAQQILDAASHAWTQALAGAIVSGVSTLGAMAAVGVSTVKAINANNSSNIQSAAQNLKLANGELSPANAKANFDNSLKGLSADQGAQIKAMFEKAPEGQHSLSVKSESLSKLNSALEGAEVPENEIIAAKQALGIHTPDDGGNFNADLPTAEQLSQARTELRAEIKATVNEQVNNVQERVNKGEITQKEGDKLKYAIRAGGAAELAKCSTPTEVAIDIENAKADFKVADDLYAKDRSVIKWGAIANITSMAQTGLFGQLASLVDKEGNLTMQRAEAQAKLNVAVEKMVEMREDQSKQNFDTFMNIIQTAIQVVKEVLAADKQLADTIARSYA